MLRDVLKKHNIGMDPGFRLRGEEHGRIEAVTDTGFALGIGLLLISTQSPENLHQLIDFTRDLLPFGMCMSLIMLVWYQHYIFFLRYGFRNSAIVVLNTVLVFIILFYVYPLKFLAQLLVLIYGTLLGRLVGAETSMGTELQEMIGGASVARLMAIYGLGAAGIFFVLVFMYRYALRHSAALELTELEVFDTKTSVAANLIMALIPLASVVLALTIPHAVIGPMLSGFTYVLYFPAMLIFGRKANRQRLLLLRGSAAPSVAQDAPDTGE